MKADYNPSVELAEVLAKKIPFEMVAETLFRALTATTVSRSGAIEPDTARQIQAAAIILENRVGRAVTRREVIQVNLDADSSIGLEERLARSPALRRSLAAVMAKFEDGASAIEA